MTRSFSGLLLVVVLTAIPIVGLAEERWEWVNRMVPECIEVSVGADAALKCYTSLSEGCDAFPVPVPPEGADYRYATCEEEAETALEWAMKAEQDFLLSIFADARYSRFPRLSAQLHQSQQVWNDYTNATCDLEARRFPLTPDKPEGWETCRIRLTLQRIFELRELHSSFTP